MQMEIYRFIMIYVSDRDVISIRKAQKSLFTCNSNFSQAWLSSSVRGSVSPGEEPFFFPQCLGEELQAKHLPSPKIISSRPVLKIPTEWSYLQRVLNFPTKKHSHGFRELNFLPAVEVEVPCPICSTIAVPKKNQNRTSPTFIKDDQCYVRPSRSLWSPCSRSRSSWANCMSPMRRQGAYDECVTSEMLKSSEIQWLVQCWAVAEIKRHPTVAPNTCMSKHWDTCRITSVRFASSFVRSWN